MIKKDAKLLLASIMLCSAFGSIHTIHNVKASTYDPKVSFVKKQLQNHVYRSRSMDHLVHSDFREYESDNDYNSDPTIFNRGRISDEGLSDDNSSDSDNIFKDSDNVSNVSDFDYVIFNGHHMKFSFRKNGYPGNVPSQKFDDPNSDADTFHAKLHNRTLVISVNRDDSDSVPPKAVTKIKYHLLADHHSGKKFTFKPISFKDCDRSFTFSNGLADKNILNLNRVKSR